MNHLIYILLLFPLAASVVAEEDVLLLICEAENKTTYYEDGTCNQAGFTAQVTLVASGDYIEGLWGKDAKERIKEKGSIEWTWELITDHASAYYSLDTVSGKLTIANWNDYDRRTSRSTEVWQCRRVEKRITE